MKSNGDSPEQADLFSPAGLERIFKTPKDQSLPSKQAGSRGLSFLQDLDTLPSSPPLLPTTLPTPDQSFLDRYNQPSELEPVEEVDEDEELHHINNNLAQQTVDKINEHSEPSIADAQCPKSPAEKGLPLQAKQATIPKRSSPPQTSKNRDNSKDSIAAHGKDHDRTISGQSELRHEGFSPVFLTKRDASQGKIDYTVPEGNGSLSRHTASSDKAENKGFQTKNYSDVVEGSSRLAESLPDNLETGTPEVAEIGDFVSVKRGGYSEVGSFKRRPLSLSFNMKSSELSGRFSPMSTNFSSPPSDVLPPGFHPPARFRKASSIRLSSRLSQSRSSKSPTSSPSSLVQTPIVIPKRGRQIQCLETEESDSGSVDSGAQVDKTADGKRPRSSPVKERTPKRQKTIHGTEFSEISKSVLDAVQARHETLHSVIGRKRKDARQDSSALQADPLALARRHILRPRNPTPSQRRGTQMEIEEQESDSFDLFEAPIVEAVQEQLESLVLGASSPAPASAPPLPEPVAMMTMNAAKRMQAEGRKRSYTTQDYLDEAMQIMNKLRAGRKPESGLGSVQESASEHHSDNDPELATDLTNLAVSRPPSREGAASGWRKPVQERVDTELAVRLRRYQERDNTEFTINSSLGSLHLATDHDTNGSHFDAALKDPSNIVIHETDAGIKPEKYEIDTEKDRDDPSSYGSATNKTQSAPQSWDSSTGRTIATSSTRRSETAGNLAPKAVAHLIPEQVGGMSFDPERHLWVKDKSLPKSIKGTGDISTAEESEQDPLCNIPDLSVDEPKERSRNVSLAGGTTDILKKFAEDPSSSDHPNRALEVPDIRSDRASSSQETVIARPRTREGSETPGEPSSVPSKDAQLTSSTVPVVETRATSWTTDQTVQNSKERTRGALSDSQPRVSEMADNDIEAEIQAINRSIPRNSRRNVKKVTISFSSPAIPRMPGWNDSYVHTERIRTHLSSNTRDSMNNNKTQLQNQRHKEQPPEASISSMRRANSNTNLFKKQASHVKSFSQIQEQDEWSLLPVVDDMRELSFQISVSSPQAGEVIQSGDNALVSPSPQNRADLTFYLSDLPDFSFHQIDDQRPSERVLAERLARYELAQIGDPFGETTKSLVRELTNVEPEEPYWDELQRLDLHDRHLTALHGLDEFCSQVKNLDVSMNGLRDLGGAPITIRRLKAHDNLLSNLTSFAFLANLHYLDISKNKIESLEGLGCLIHLRELKADDNEITELYGLEDLDGLQKLQLRRNRIETIDLTISRLDYLAELDLSGNRISSVRGLNYMPQLHTLVLDDNKLQFESFSLGDEFSCPSVSVLKLRRNLLTHLPTTLFPNLRILLADGNQIAVDVDLSRLDHLETFSLREQQLDESPRAESGFVEIPSMNVRQLVLTANRIPTFSFTHFMYDLQRLELASCGIHSLPSDFGGLVPNLRFLNLNFNALKDIRPLANTVRLFELHLAGNRLSRIRRILLVLANWKSLVKIDLRDNPITVGFYPQGRPVTTDIVLRSAQNSHDGEDPYVLPQQSRKEDRDFRTRLDEETYLKRRVYELLLASRSKDLRVVDGLEFDRSEVLVKDAAWEQLVYGGVIRRR